MSTARMASNVGRVLGGRYRLMAPIGSGSSSQVYVATDVTLHRRVAVKLLRAELAGDERFLERFRAEARTAASLNHPHVLAVYDWGEDAEPYIVTEYLAGGSLRAMLDTGVRLSPSQALVVGVEATRALEFAHRRGLVHRDIKPANLLFDDEGHLRIADFGLARALAEASVTEPSDVVVGTARYASPEQARGEPLDGKSDVYSLALVLTEAVAGSLPYDADTTIATLMARIDQPLVLDGRFGALSSPLERAATIDRQLRPDAEGFSVALMAAAEQLPRPDPLLLAGAVAPPGNLAAAGEQDPTALAPPVAPPVVPREAEPAPTPPARRLRQQEKVARYQARIEREQRRAATGRDRSWLWALVALVLLGGAGTVGYLAWDASQAASHTVPSLIGTSFDDLEATVADNGWEIDKREQRVEGTTAGEIVDQDPQAGAELDEGGTLTVVVSRGPPLVPVPTDIIGFHLEEAETRLQAVGLAAGEVTERFDDDALAGVVLEIDEVMPELEPGSTVDLVVSAGPEPRVIPDGLLRLSVDEIQARLAEERLVGVVVEEHDPDAAEGDVMAIEPGSGTEVAADSEVRIIVSLGPEPVEVPDVVGLPAAEATEELRDAGLCVEDTEGPADTEVLATDPVAGEIVEADSCIRVITRSPASGDDDEDDDGDG